jgi:hypothetical protein
MQRVEVQSEAISAVQYSRPNRTLIVWYRNGGVYEYENVTEYLYRRLLLNNPHPWSAVGKLVKDHPYKKLEPQAEGASPVSGEAPS